MLIQTRFAMSADGYVTTPDGWPAQLADPSWVGGQSHGFPEFQRTLEAVVMGRTTFEPALGADRWPWPDLDVFVLGSDVRTEGARAPIVSDSDPERLLSAITAANRAARSTSSAGRRRSRRSARWAPWTGSACSCCRSSSAAGAG
jgi:dihydrofolate reductase